MGRSVPDIAKHFYATVKDSIFQSHGFRAAYRQMDQESDNEDDGHVSRSLFYSVQHNGIEEESIPMTNSQAYSDRSQLLFDQELDDREEYYAEHSQHFLNTSQYSAYEESPKPSAIYLEAPADATGPSSTLPKPASLSESLLPTSTAVAPGVTHVKSERKYRDPFFAILYCLCLFVFLLSGIVVFFSTDSHALERAARGTTFKTIIDSAGVLFAMISTALVAGAAWFWIMRTFTKTIVWGTVIGVPFVLLSIFLWAIIESRISPDPDSSLTAWSFLPLVTTVIFTWSIYKNRHKISKTIAIIELACDVIQQNPGIILVSLALMGVFIVFTAVWLTFFTKLWLIGYLDKSSSSVAWVVNKNVYTLAAFYIFIYMWSAAILLNVQRFALSSITAHWYFHRHDAASSAKTQAWKAALHRAFTNSLGTLALGGLILSIVQCLQLATRYLQKLVKRGRFLMSLLSVCISFVEALISQINHYTITLAGITGESFFASAFSSTKIFRRNLLVGLLGDLLTKLILYIGAMVISFSSGFGAYIFATHSLQSSHGFVVGLIAAIMPLYISQFFSYTMMSVVDATFLCYAIDLDMGMVHMSAAHTIFSSFD